MTIGSASGPEATDVRAYADDGPNFGLRVDDKTHAEDHTRSGDDCGD